MGLRELTEFLQNYNSKMNTVWVCLKPVLLELDFCLKYLSLVVRGVLSSARSFSLAGMGKVVLMPSTASSGYITYLWLSELFGAHETIIHLWALGGKGAGDSGTWPGQCSRFTCDRPHM